ncbi:elongation factor G [Bifidobacterium choloepi]|uniref:TetM/TetW/TetO/TetS family tetracycline resistance ribosomal protection protein n=1 Tax=Bifidobacterium choloepi TaxID=2614131 RepID=A0A6I5N1V1_9BIFI|nr:TetM/TetW/TetO/TetS family tetracycline resistance ribosomal protection protein [Bifidobacterium choloepi]NEG70456.1 TetM/TetW/TetO/TetS family tetracycline resistance ribosomal protection protein [Bifidobacterium choloepi]
MTQRIVAGIVAHVDAGKTTLSEALLYQSGKLRKLGRVDHGDAYLDSDDIEKARGITIFAEPAILDLPGRGSGSPAAGGAAGNVAGADDGPADDIELTLIDTPGHVDFAAETERALAVLDYAVLVVSGTDGVQGHTETLWRLLRHYHVPTFVFVNKMDAPTADRAVVLAQLRRRFGDGVVDFSENLDDSSEDIAMQDEAATEEFLDAGTLSTATIARLVAERKVFPVYFGSALKLDGVDEFLDGFATYARQPAEEGAGEFAARVYKISHDAQGNRLTWLKVTGGTLRAKMMLETDRAGESFSEKADQVRLYSGAKFETVAGLPAGSVAAVAGPGHTYPGEGLGAAADVGEPTLQPVLTYTLLPGDNDIHKCLLALRELGDEDPLLHVVWDAALQEVRVQLMGAVQLEIVEQLLHDRFGLDVTFSPGSILYKETILAPVEGAGHFEPLRHYAEAHILIEPLPEGSGVEVASAMSEDDLDRNWQRLIMTHLRERDFAGVLVGAPLTDVRLTLVAARAHDKHTEGGDFRQATYRAVRQGLMEARAGVAIKQGLPGIQPDSASPYEVAERYGGDSVDEASPDETEDAGAQRASETPSSEGVGKREAFSGGSSRATGNASNSTEPSGGDDSAEPLTRCRIAGTGNCQLLEPWYRFRLEVPQDLIGRAMADIQRMAGSFGTPATDGDYAVLEGTAPVAEMRDYAMAVNAYAHGRGHLTCSFDGYHPCHNQDDVLADPDHANYDPERDLENTPDSVFCAHGAGYPVKWYKVPEFMHLPYATAM